MEFYKNYKIKEISFDKRNLKLYLKNIIILNCIRKIILLWIVFKYQNYEIVFKIIVIWNCIKFFCIENLIEIIEIKFDEKQMNLKIWLKKLN